MKIFINYLPPKGFKHNWVLWTAALITIIGILHAIGPIVILPISLLLIWAHFLNPNP